MVEGITHTPTPRHDRVPARVSTDFSRPSQDISLPTTEGGIPYLPTQGVAVSGAPAAAPTQLPPAAPAQVSKERERERERASEKERERTRESKRERRRECVCEREGVCLCKRERD